MPSRARKLPFQPADDVLAPRDFERIAEHIRGACGIQIPATKRTMLEGRLRRRARELGIERLSDYAEWALTGGNLALETPHLINVVTTNKTDFFRESAHFDYLMREILPAIVLSGQSKIRAWSSACSNGAEPYTLAMVLDAFASEHGGPEYGILATDIDTNVLEDARRGVYPAQSVAPVPQAYAARYVMHPRERARCEVRMAPELRSAIGFARMNLMDGAYPVGDPMDIIFCRNVLIYFNKPTQDQVVSRLVDKLRPGGWLFLGHAESAAGTDPRITCVANTIYQRN